MQNIETHNLNGNESTALVYNNADIESREIGFSEVEFIDWIIENEHDYILDLDDKVRVDPYSIVTDVLVLKSLNN